MRIKLKRPKPTKPLPDPWKVYNHATRFIMAEEHLRAAANNQNVADFGAPAIVMSAFASELLLKCLHVMHGQHPPDDSHRLHVLYRQLPNKVKDRIEALWDAQASQRDETHKEVEYVLRTEPQMAHMANFVIPRDLETSLKMSGDAFVRMRYIYEHELGGAILYP